MKLSQPSPDYVGLRRKNQDTLDFKLEAESDVTRLASYVSMVECSLFLVCS